MRATYIRFVVVATLWSRCSFAAPTSRPSGAFSPNSFGQPGNATFDYVVIGGGTAGLTIASRLALKHSVAIVEAGGFYQIQNGNGSVIPALGPLQAAGTSPNLTLPLVDWSIVTTPQAGANGRSLHYARGKTLGGSSARHFLIYHRATAGAYQQWADQVGDQSYTFEHLLPYLERSCNLTPPDMSKRQPNGSVSYDPSVFDNSLGGPLHISWPNWADPLSTWALKGMASIGMPLSQENFNSGILNGSAWITTTINPYDSSRDSSQTSFLAQAFEDTSLLVYTEAMAKRILFDDNKTATGVLVDQAGAQFVLSANKEVILSAGAFQSPQLLMVSGVGPRTTLQAHGIPIVTDLPGVGQNLQDQPLFGTGFRVNVLTGSASLNNPTYAASVAQMYRDNSSGPLTSNSADVVGWEKLPGPSRANFTPETKAALSRFPPDWPEAEYVSTAGFNGANTDFATADPRDGFNYGTMAAVLVAPLSRGSVTISSPDARDPPVVDPGWLTDPADQQVAVAAFRRLRALWAAMPDVTLGPEYFPGEAVASDEQVLDFVRETLAPVWHASATCAMGKAGDPGAVVDSRARVFGVAGLRVVDSSAFPFLPPGHPQGTVYALAEKIAEDVLCEG